MIKIDASLIFVFLIVWILVFVLSRIFFRPLRKLMQERENKVQGNKEVFQKAMEAFEQTASEIEKRIKSANARSLEIKEELEREALKERERILAEINAEYRAEVEKAKEKLEEQTERLKKELGSEAGRLAERIERKLLH